MDEEETRNYPVYKTDECPLDSIDESKNNRTPEYNGPKPELCPSELRIVIQDLQALLVIQGTCNPIVRGWIAGHIYSNRYYLCIKIFFFNLSFLINFKQFSLKIQPLIAVVSS